MVWVFIVFVALLIPILAIVLDSPVARSWARRLERPGALGAREQELFERLEQLEDEVEGLTRALESQREEVHFLGRLLQDPDRALPPAGDGERSSESGPGGLGPSGRA